MEGEVAEGDRLVFFERQRWRMTKWSFLAVIWYG